MVCGEQTIHGSEGITTLFLCIAWTAAWDVYLITHEISHIACCFFHAFLHHLRRKLIHQAFQMLSLLNQLPNPACARAFVRVLGDRLVDERVPGGALPPELRGDLVLDASARARARVPEAGVDLDERGAGARVVERVRARRDPAAANEDDIGREAGAQDAERGERERFERGAGQAARFHLVR